MSTKPLIGISGDFKAAQGSTPAFHYLAAGYTQRVLAAGGVPVVIPPLDDDDEMIHSLLDALDGFVMADTGMQHKPVVARVQVAAARHDESIQCIQQR
ncbi:MAG: gamma-glutamyl-gamma-aminobutyrate hydrolase family protein, partial [Planctomycetota bacterium]